MGTIITIKAISEELKEDGNPKHIEWEAMGADGKDIKVKLYPQVKLGDEWIHFEDRWDEFRKAQNKTYDIERANIKVEKGYWKPIIKATQVKDILKQQALEELQTTAQDNKQMSIEGQVALKEIGELLRANTEIAATFCESHQKLIELYFIKLYDIMNKFVYGGEKEHKETKVSQEVPIVEVKASSQPKSIEPALKNVGELFSRCVKAGINRKQAMELLGITHPSEIVDLDDAWQTILEKSNKRENPEVRRC